MPITLNPSNHIKDCSVFTECYKCNIIAFPMIESYCKYHTDTLNVICHQSDADLLKMFQFPINIIPVDAEAYYNKGHAGTAFLLSEIITNEKNTNSFIHIDSDVIFQKESLSLLNDDNCALIGQRRNYKNNPQNNDRFRPYQDVVSTCFFKFDRRFISKYPKEILFEMCLGVRNPLKHPTIDFFDPVCFDILKNKGSIKYLSRHLVGGFDEDGKIKNTAPFENADLDYGQHIVHFAGIGSGYRFSRDKYLQAPQSYKDWCIRRWNNFETHVFPMNDNLTMEQKIERFLSN